MKQSFRVFSAFVCLSFLLTGCAVPVSSSVPAPEAKQLAPETSAPETDQPAQVPEPESEPTVVWPDPGIEGNLAEVPSVKDDFAAFVNFDWYKNKPIPNGYSAWSNFNELDKIVREQMLETLKSPDESADQQKAAALFSIVNDTAARDAAGLGMLQKTFDALLNVKSIDELNGLFASDQLLFSFTPMINIGVGTDNKNSDMNVTLVFAPGLSLTDSAEYTELTEQGRRIKYANEKLDRALLIHNGVDEARADAMTAAMFDFETKLAKGVYPTSVSYRDDYFQLIYNEYSPEELAMLTPSFPFMDVMTLVGLGSASRFIVSEPEALKTLDSLYNEENLEGIKAYLAIYLLASSASYCDSFSVEADIECNNAVYGSTGRKSDDIRAYDVCQGCLGELMGRIYAAKYFNEDSKADVTGMVYEIFDAYKARLSSADWLTDATRATAVEKLDAMTLRIGYPEVYRNDWDKVTADKNKPLIDNIIQIQLELMRQNHENADKPVNRELWDMSANTVNAYYNPSDNSINFPAAILNPPFYDSDGTRSENLGGIGNVIAHEITHAFDTNGSQFDKRGNMQNWWTDEDRAAFKTRTDKLAARFAAIEVQDGEHVRGDLTIGETVADLGAVSCTLDIMREQPDADYKSYFETFTKIWAQRITPEMRVYYLKYDAHPPTYLRPNVMLQQFKEFYDTFDITEGDFMYTAPENRLRVW